MTGKIAITPRSLSGAGHPALSLLTERGYELVFPAPAETPSEARRIGISVERAAGANAQGVAELAIALMLGAFRHVPWSDAQLHGGTWARRQGIEADGRVLGVMGCGAIGQIVTRIALGMGMRVLGYDPCPSVDFAPPGFRYASLDELLGTSDAISLHCPPAEQPLVGPDEVACLKPGVVIVNTARAELIDDAAVLTGLKDGRIGCLATDVYHSEPPVPSALLSHDRVICTPHAGGFTRESIARATEMAVRNILRVLEA